MALQYAGKGVVILGGCILCRSLGGRIQHSADGSRRRLLAAFSDTGRHILCCSAGSAVSGGVKYLLDAARQLIPDSGGVGDGDGIHLLEELFHFAAQVVLLGSGLNKTGHQLCVEQACKLGSPVPQLRSAVRQLRGFIGKQSHVIQQVFTARGKEPGAVQGGIHARVEFRIAVGKLAQLLLQSCRSVI